MHVAQITGRARPFLRLTGSALLAIIAIAASALSAHADTVFNNVTGSLASGGYAIEGSSSIGYQAEAQAFTPGANYTMTGASVFMFASTPSGQGTDNLFNMSLFSNVSGVPGVMIASLGEGLAAPAQPGSLVTVSTAGISLENGAEYWLVLSPFDANSASGWALDGTSATPAAFNYSGSLVGGWETYDPGTSQFAIDGTPAAVAATPEPGSFTLFLTGGLGVAAALYLRGKNSLSSQQIG